MTHYLLVLSMICITLAVAVMIGLLIYIVGFIINIGENFEIGE